MALPQTPTRPLSRDWLWSGMIGAHVRGQMHPLAMQLSDDWDSITAVLSTSAGRGT